MNGVEARGCVTIIAWLSYLGILAFAMTSIGVWVALLAFVLMIPLIVIMGGMWGMFGDSGFSSDQNDSMSEKRKRERIDSVLRDLSDGDLEALRRRLQDGSINDKVLYDQLLGDDGEIVQGYDS